MDRQELRDQVRMVMPDLATDVDDTRIDAILNQGLQEVGLAADWPFLEASTTVTFVDSQQTYALPADFNWAVSLVDDDHDTYIPYISPEDFFQRFGNDTGNESDTPNYWTIWENSIYLTPIPSSADTDRLTLYYYKTVTTLSTDGTEPEFHTAFHPILIEYAKWKLYERAEAYEQAFRAGGMYQERLREMIQWYGRRANRYPMIAGDGDSIRGPYDPNIPFLRQI